MLDIKIKHTNLPNEYVSHYRKAGENMYNEIIFIFENGYQLEISSDIDYMYLSEKPIWYEQQNLAKSSWNDYYNSKQYLEEYEKNI